MYQYVSIDKTQSEKSKANTPATNKSHMQIGMKMPVQTKGLFTHFFNQKNDGEKSSSNHVSRLTQLMPLPDSPLQMQLMPKQEQRGIQPLPLEMSESQNKLAPIPSKLNNTGIPLQMKQKFESLSGFSFDDVKVHYNSDKPAQLQALAYTQGSQVYVAPGQERHLGHELGHVVQQKRGAVRPTTRFEGVSVNDDSSLEREADVMGVGTTNLKAPLSSVRPADSSLVQRRIGFELEYCVPTMPLTSSVNQAFIDNATKQARKDRITNNIRIFLGGGVKYGLNYGGGEGFHMTADHNNLSTLHNNIIEGLVNRGYLSGDTRTEPMSNLEYVTDHKDETSLEINKIIDAIVTHAGTIFPNAQTQMFPIGSATLITGIPETDLRNWLEAGDYTAVEQEINAYKDRIKDSFYLQATVGIIPSSIRALLKSQLPGLSAVDTPRNQAKIEAIRCVDKRVTELFNNDFVINHSYIKELKEGKKGTFSDIPPSPVDYAIFESVVHMIFSYIVGNALVKTDIFDISTEKNAIPFMSKMEEIHYVITKAAPTFAKRRPNKDLVKKIDELLKGCPESKAEHWKATFGLHDSVHTRRIIQDTFVADVLLGKTTDVVNSGRTIKDPDKMKGKPGGQQGAQFEYRWIAARPSRATLKAELNKIVDDVKSLNSRVPGSTSIEMEDM